MWKDKLCSLNNNNSQKLKINIIAEQYDIFAENVDNPRLQDIFKMFLSLPGGRPNN